MKRKEIKDIDVHDVIQNIEEIELKKTELVEMIRQEEMNEMDCGFYFSVVFNTRKERDNWLKKHNIKLAEDFIVKAEDFIS